MLSNTSNATWVSATSTQGAGETDWNAYQPALTGTSQKFTLVPSASTTTSLSTYDGYTITGGQQLLLSTNNTSVTSGTTGTVSAVVPASFTFTAGTSNTAFGNITNSVYSTAGGMSAFMKPDGTLLWATNGTLIVEYAMSTPFDITTATANGRTAGTPSQTRGVTFSQDGSIIYLGDFGNSYKVTMIRLGVAWDITTAGTPMAFTLPTPTNALSFSYMLGISADGTKLWLVDSQKNSTNCGNYVVYSLTSAFNPATASVLYSSTRTVWANSSIDYNGAYPLSINFSPDGRTSLVFVQNTSTTCFAIFYTLGTPWNMATASQLGTTQTVFSGSPITGNLFGFAVTNQIGTAYCALYFTGSTTSAVKNYTINMNAKYNVDITAFGLGAAPVAAFSPIPSMSVDMETQANRVNMFPYQLDFTSATTTQAIVNAYGNASGGVIQTGDAILLNGTTSVTTTGVTQGNVGAVAAKNLGLSDNYFTYSGKFGSLGGYGFGIKFVPDGSSFIMVQYSGPYTYQVVQYGLSVPWDVSTIYGVIGVFNPRNGSSLVTSSSLMGCEFNNDGSKLIVLCGSTANTYPWAFEFSLGQKYRISSVSSYVTSVGVIAITWSGSAAGGRFNLNGSQYYGWASNSSGSYFFFVVSCPTPFSLVGASTGSSYGSSTFFGTRMPLLEPNGNYVITIGNRAGEQTLSVNNDLTSIQNSIDVISASPGQISFASVPYLNTNYPIAHDFSVDGTKYYAVGGNGEIYQFNVRTLPLTQYTCTFATQPGAPTSVSLPDRSVSQSITTSLSAGNMQFSMPLVNKTGRAVAMKISSANVNASITNATLNLYKS